MGNFNMLPAYIIFDILTRLPTETVLDCKLVSESWNTIVRYESFSQNHSDRFLKDLDSAGKFTFLFLNDNPSCSSSEYREFNYLEYYDDKSSEKSPFHRVTRLKLNPAPFKHYVLVGSCNGLVCLNGCHDNGCPYEHDNGCPYEPIYICNPITRECVFLPEFERTNDRGKLLLTGFGYVSSTDEYKVVRMYKLLRERPFLGVEVYTLGSGNGWRTTRKKFDEDLDLFYLRGLLVNETLYFKDTMGKIVAFDLANEIFVDIPQAFPPLCHFKLGVLGGYLSAVRYNRSSNTSDLWLLKKKEEDGSLSWIEEFSLSNTDTHESLALSCRGTVLCCSSTKVQSHDLNSSSSELLVDFGMDRSIVQAIPHINTLVSLKALGEENTKTMETVDVPREVQGFKKRKRGAKHSRIKA